MSLLLGIFASVISAIYVKVTRSLSTFTNSGVSIPWNQSGYNQGMARAFPSANVMMVHEGYRPPFPTVSANVYSMSSGSSGFTSRTAYPTTIFQTTTREWDGKYFVFGGNGLNGSAGGGSTNAVRYMTTSLNSWTSGTNLPAVTSVNVGRTTNNLYFVISGTAYKGNGIGPWSTTTLAPGEGPAYLNSELSYCFSGSATYYSTNDGASWVNAGITPPIASAPGYVLGNEGNQSGYPIYMAWDTYTSNPKMYYFSGEGFTLTNCFGQENASGDYTTATNIGVGLLNNQYICVRSVGSQQYATVNT
jgi:hypothetical protein